MNTMCLSPCTYFQTRVESAFLARVTYVEKDTTWKERRHVCILFYSSKLEKGRVELRTKFACYLSFYT